MNVKMPGMNDLTVAPKIHYSDPNSRVVMLAMFDDYLSDAFEAGAAGFLRKDLPGRDWRSSSGE